MKVWMKMLKMKMFEAVVCWSIDHDSNLGEIIEYGQWRRLKNANYDEVEMNDVGIENYCMPVDRVRVDD